MQLARIIGVFNECAVTCSTNAEVGMLLFQEFELEVHDLLLLFFLA